MEYSGGNGIESEGDYAECILSKGIENEEPGRLQ